MLRAALNQKNHQRPRRKLDENEDALGKGKNWADIEGRLRDEALKGIGDGGGTSFSSSGDYLENFVDVSGDPPGVGFSSELASGRFEFSPKKRELRTRVSYSMSGCICRDVGCRRAAAVDLVGARQADNGEARGYTPIVLLDEDAGEVPCLTVAARPAPPASAVRY